MLELATGLLLGFALAFLYLLGAITITGSSEITMVPSDPAGFRRIAVIMTLLGLGGWLSSSSRPLIAYPVGLMNNSVLRYTLKLTLEALTCLVSASTGNTGATLRVAREVNSDALSGSLQY